MTTIYYQDIVILNLMDQVYNKIKAIFFDVGDTLYSNEELEKAYPKKLYELISTTKNLPLEKAKELLNSTTEKLKATEKHVTKVRAMAELGYPRAQVHEAFCKIDPFQFLEKDPELVRVISLLASKYQLGLISNFRKSHLIQIINALGLTENQFPTMVTEDIVKEIKPAHEPFKKAIELAGGLPSEVLYVGDSPSKDMMPAKEVGMMTILVKENPTPGDLQNADGHVSKVADLIKLL